MAVPDFQSFFKPLLDIAADGQEHSRAEVMDAIAASLQMTPDDLSEMLPSGAQSRFANRVAWARSYFVQAKVLEPTRRGYFKITQRGLDLHRQGHARIDINILSQYPEFVEFHTPQKKEPGQKMADIFEKQAQTPEEIFQQAYENIRGELASSLLLRVKENSPSFFEGLVVDLMVAMGYGGSRADAGKSLGKSGDEGLDGIIKEDRLGLDVIYLQAKRWEGTVGRPEIQKFVGALHGKRAKKGVFITTGKFSEDAKQYVESIDPKIVLIDGQKLADYMIDFNLGVTITSAYEIKKIDIDYFSEE
jgi:restriction system protein